MPTTQTIESFFPPFGMVMPGRNWQAGSADEYGFGFNGKLKDDEIKGNSKSLDFGARIYDARLGKWLKLDSEYGKWPDISPYTYVANNPIWLYEIDGNIFDYSNLSTEQAEKFKTIIETMKSENIYFQAIFSHLESSSNVYTFNINVDQESPGYFLVNNEHNGGEISFISTDFIESNGAGFREEFFHAYQFEFYGYEKMYNQIGGSNIEFEPRFLETFNDYYGFNNGLITTMPGEEALDEFVLSLDPKSEQLTDEQLVEYVAAVEQFRQFWEKLNEESNSDNNYDDPVTKDGPSAAYSIINKVRNGLKTGEYKAPENEPVIIKPTSDDE